jgi:hypothetical protein
LAPPTGRRRTPFRAGRSQKRHLAAMFVSGLKAGSRILRRMNPVIAIILLAAPFALLAAGIAVLIVYLGNRTK